METEQQAEAVVLSEKKVEQLAKQPIIESFVSRSQDGRRVVHKTVITDIVNAQAFTDPQSPALRTSSR